MLAFMVSRSDLRGRKIGAFEVTERLGEGGMGIVYAATDERLRRTVALKVLRPHLARDPRRRTRFLREARFVAALAHPNVVNVYEVGEVDGVVFMSMELVEGTSLRSWLGTGALTLGQSLTLARDIGRALARAHEKGIVHRDLKPDNVIVYEPNPGSLTVKVLDFGLAKAFEPPTPLRRGPRPIDDVIPSMSFVTAEGVALGTPGYMSPEQARGFQVDARSDVYSFGIIFYEMLTHRRLACDVDGEVIPPSAVDPKIPDAIDDVVLRCLAKAPLERFASGAVLLERLEELHDAFSDGAIGKLLSPPPIDFDIPIEHAPTSSLAIPRSRKLVAPIRPMQLSAPELPEPPPRPARIPRAARPAALAVLFATIVLVFATGRLSAIGTKAASAATAVTTIASASTPTPTPSPEPTTCEATPTPTPAPTTSAIAPKRYAPPPVVVRSAKPVDDCNPPFTTDESGVRIPKRQCLRK